MKFHQAIFLTFAFLFGLAKSNEANAQDNGKALYEQHCSSCHKKNEKGLMRIYPPLLESEWLQSDSTLINLALNGLSGEILVKGRNYDKEMPALAQWS